MDNLKSQIHANVFITCVSLSFSTLYITRVINNDIRVGDDEKWLYYREGGAIRGYSTRNELMMRTMIGAF